MNVEYVELVDYLAIAVEVTGIRSEAIARVAKLDLAESDVDNAEQAVLAIASSSWDEARAADWLRHHLSAPPDRDEPEPR